MRDIVFAMLMSYGLVQCLRRPWIGALIWVWVGLMSPHRFTYGFAFNLPWAAMVAGALIIGVLATKDRMSPFRSAPAWLLVAFMAWVTISWLNGRFTEAELPLWSRAMKTFAMLFVVMSVLYTEKHIKALVWVVLVSLATLGVKGGLFTIATGGSYRVWGPPDSWVGENNAFAVALIMVIPLLRFLQLQLHKPWQRHGVTLAMVLCAASALGSQSRGALLSVSAMTLLLWWRGRSRLLGGIAMVGVACALVSFMPDSWTSRMETINTYKEDGSAMSRIAAWTVARGLAADNFTGAGFTTSLREYFLQYANFETGGIVAHSIYFEVLGQHGYVGLLIYLCLGLATWRSASKVRKMARDIPQAKWCVELVSMCQVSLLGFAVGGAFLTLAFYDLTYYLMAMIVLTRQWVERRGWEVEASLPDRVIGRPRLTSAGAPSMGQT